MRKKLFVVCFEYPPKRCTCSAVTWLSHREEKQPINFGVQVMERFSDVEGNEGTAPETRKPFLYAQHGSVTTCVLGGVMNYS